MTGLFHDPFIMDSPLAHGKEWNTRAIGFDDSKMKLLKRRFKIILLTIASVEQ
jgi:hypothetical protein